MDVFLGYKPDLNGPHIWEIKPTIDHYPSQELLVLERKKWYE